MDTQNVKLVAKGDFQAALSGRKVVVGAKQLRKTMKAGSVSHVYLAKNADPAITEPLEALCKKKNVQYTWVKSMADLGRACGIEVGAATAAVVD